MVGKRVGIFQRNKFYVCSGLCVGEEHFFEVNDRSKRKGGGEIRGENGFGRWKLRVN